MAFASPDAAIAYLAAGGNWPPSVVLCLGWFAGFILIGTAAVRDRPIRPEARPAAERTLSGLALNVPYLLAAVGIGTAVWQQVGGPVTANPTLVVASGLIAALLSRQLLLVENRRLIARLEGKEVLLKRQMDTLADQALHDGLTGLANRRLFYDQLNRAVALHGRNRRPVAMLMCRLDAFKAVNDTLGHVAGDNLLVRVAPRLEASTREGDTLARLGGDEFDEKGISAPGLPGAPPIACSQAHPSQGPQRSKGSDWRADEQRWARASAGDSSQPAIPARWAVWPATTSCTGVRVLFPRRVNGSYGESR